MYNIYIYIIYNIIYIQYIYIIYNMYIYIYDINKQINEYIYISIYIL